MKLFGNPGSTCTRKVMLTLAEKNTQYEFIKIDLGKGEHKQPDYLAKHPFGVVPFLEDDGFTIYESRAIIRYLDKRLAGISLTPTDVRQFGQMEQWLGIEQAYFTPPALQMLKEIIFAPLRGKQPDVALIEAARPKVMHALAIANKHLAKQTYFAGEQFSLADISWVPYIDYFFPAKLDQLINEQAHVKAWWERVSQRATWQQVKK